MYEGLQGAGADDAWYSKSLEVEHAMLYGLPLVGAITDLYKCFDQIIRLIAYIILLISGFPANVLTAYVNYQQDAEIYFSFSGHIGRPHKHR